MEIFTFFVCISITESVMAQLRVTSSIRVNDVLGVLAELSEFGEFFQLLKTDYNYKYNENGIIAAPSTTIFNNNLNVHTALRDMSYAFMSLSSLYLVQNLKEYCELAIEIIKHEFEGVSEKKKRESLRFLDEPEYCMLKAFYDWTRLDEDLLKVDLLFESSFFLQTIDPDAKSSLSDLEFQLRMYSNRYDQVFKLKGTKRLQRSVEPITSFKDYCEALTVIENKIADFSQAFCSSSRPFVKRYLLREKTQFNDVQNHSPFVRYMFQYEICLINFQRIPTVPNQNQEAIDERFLAENQQNRITSWNCSAILRSPEYSYQTFKKGVTPNGIKPISTNKFLWRSHSMPTGDPFRSGNKIFSLDTLKYGLKSNSYYLNIVKYYNILVDVMSKVSIKEGNKILKGIKFVVLRNCNNRETHKLNAVEMRRMRSALSEFKSLFDELVFLILDRIRINVVDNTYKMEFDKRVNSVTKLLDVQNDRMADDDQIEKICSEILKELEDVKADNHYLDDTLKFESFYFTESILNIRELYRFGANYF